MKSVGERVIRALMVNADPNHAITLVSVGYYDANGKIMGRLLKQPIELNPLSSRSKRLVTGDLRSDTGKTGCFLVTWESKEKVVEP